MDLHHQDPKDPQDLNPRIDVDPPPEDQPPSGDTVMGSQQNQLNQSIHSNSVTEESEPPSPTPQQSRSFLNINGSIFHHSDVNQATQQINKAPRVVVTPRRPNLNPFTSFNPVPIAPSKRRHIFTDVADRPKRLNSELPKVNSVSHGFDLVRTLLVQIANIATTPLQQQNILDFLEEFRNISELGRTKKKETAILNNQITRIESISRAMAHSLNQQPTVTQQPQKPTQQPQKPTKQPQKPAKQPGAANLPPVAQKPSWAKVTSQNLPKSSEWTTVTSKKVTTPTALPVLSYKSKLKLRKLVLVRDSAQFNISDSLTIRNKINQAFFQQGITKPVVVSATRSHQGNIVLVTTPEFSGQYLLEKLDIWKSTTQFKEAVLIQDWFKVVVHGVPCLEGYDIAGVKSELKEYNRLEVVGNPYWISNQERRERKGAGSICIAFKTEQEANRAIKQPCYVLGASCKVELYYSVPRTSQCAKCQKFGHLEARCHASTSCKICSEPHSTAQHKCNTCSTVGSVCLHTIRKCINCLGAHTADSKQCETYLAIFNKDKPEDIQWESNPPATNESSWSNEG